MADKVVYTFNNASPGDTAGNAVNLSNWGTFGQGGNASEIIVLGTDTNRLQCNTEGGLWSTAFKTNQIYGDCDFTVVIDNNSANGAFISPRAQIDSTTAPSGYGMNVIPSAGYIGLYKNCSNAQFTMATFTIAPFSSHFKARAVIEGLILSAYINDVFIGSFDFTGNVFCSFAAYFTGYPSVTAFNANYTFDPGDKTPSYILV